MSDRKSFRVHYTDNQASKDALNDLKSQSGSDMPFVVAGDGTMGPDAAGAGFTDVGAVGEAFDGNSDKSGSDNNTVAHEFGHVGGLPDKDKDDNTPDLPPPVNNNSSDIMWYTGGDEITEEWCAAQVKNFGKMTKTK